MRGDLGLPAVNQTVAGRQAGVLLLPLREPRLVNVSAQLPDSGELRLRADITLRCFDTARLLMNGERV